MKRKLKIFALILLLTFQSCYKEEDDLISQNCDKDCAEIVGKIMTDFGTVPIPNLKITVTWDNIPSLGSGIIRTKATTRTDSEGNYHLKFYLRDDELEEGGYRMFYEELDKDQFHRADLNGISGFQISRDTLLIINHNVPKKAFLNLSLLNLDQYQQGDYFATYFDYLAPVGYSQSIDGLIRGWSNEWGSNQLIEVAGNQPVAIAIVRVINDIRTMVNDTIFINAGTTSDYSIDFNN